MSCHRQRRFLKQTVPCWAGTRSPLFRASGTPERRRKMCSAAMCNLTKKLRFRCADSDSKKAQDKGPHLFGGTSRAQSPAVRSFYGTRKPNRFSGKPLNSAPLTNENNDFKRHFGYHEQIGCFLQQQSNCKGHLQIIERAFSRMYRQPPNMKGRTR